MWFTNYSEIPWSFSSKQAIRIVVEELLQTRKCVLLKVILSTVVMGLEHNFSDSLYTDLSIILLNKISVDFPHKFSTKFLPVEYYLVS